MQRILAVGVAGLGLGGIVAGSVLGFGAKSTYDDSAQYCRGNACTDSGLELRSSAFSKATGSTIAFALGAAAIGGGAVLWFTAPTKPVAVGMGPSGLRLGGVW